MFAQYFSVLRPSSTIFPRSMPKNNDVNYLLSYEFSRPSSILCPSLFFPIFLYFSLHSSIRSPLFFAHLLVFCPFSRHLVLTIFCPSFIHSLSPFTLLPLESSPIFCPFALLRRIAYCSLVVCPKSTIN